MYKIGDQVTILLVEAQHYLSKRDGTRKPLDAPNSLIDLTITYISKPNPYQTLYLGIDKWNATYTFNPNNILHWSMSNYGVDICLTMEDITTITTGGRDAHPYILEIIKKPYMVPQVARLDRDKLRQEVKEWGSWDSGELDNHEDNIIRWIWIVAGDISDGAYNG